MIKYELERYDEYKESDIGWLTDVPNHWSIKRIKDLSSLQSGESIVAEQIEDEGPYPVYGGNGLRGYYSRYTNNGNHILIGRQGALCGNINYACGRFWASEHAVVVYTNKGVVITWYGEMLKVMNLNQYSLSAAQPGLAIDRIKRLLLPVPSFEEQKIISNYLDTKITRINCIIDLLTQKAAKYGELKQSLINETVTRGLDKTVAMKESGIEWIWEVPEHWVVKRFCDIFLLGNKIVSTAQMEGRDVFHYSIPLVQQTGTGQLEDGSNIDSNKALITGNEILFSKLNPRKETICITSEVNPDILTVASGEFLVLKPLRDKIFLKFGFYLFSSNFNKQKICSTVKSVTKSHQRANPADIFKMPQCIPPYEEQKAIADYLDTNTAHIDRIIETINNQIEKLKELRKTLINDVVTGKIKVCKEGETI